MPHSTDLPEINMTAPRRDVKRTRLLFCLIIVAILATLIISFCYGPNFLMAHSPDQRLPNGDDSHAVTSAQHWLKILEDNAQRERHSAAATALLRLRDPAATANLCRLAERPTLQSQRRIVTLLGHLGDDAALPTLRKLFHAGDDRVADAAIAATTTIGSPAAESLLIALLRDPIVGRQALPVIAAVKNQSAVNILSQAIAGGPLAAQAMHEIAANQLTDCTPAIQMMARDSSRDVALRLIGLETLNQLKCDLARRTLEQLQHDPRIGWKARRLLTPQ